MFWKMRKRTSEITVRVSPTYLALTDDYNTNETLNVYIYNNTDKIKRVGLRVSVPNSIRYFVGSTLNPVRSGDYTNSFCIEPYKQTGVKLIAFHVSKEMAKEKIRVYVEDGDNIIEKEVLVGLFV